MVSLKITTTLIFLLLLTIVPKSIDALCKWHGIAPFCFIGNSCPNGCAKTLENNKGDGYRCWVSHKNYCCCLPRIDVEEIGLLGSDFCIKQAKTSTIIGERINDNLVNLNFDMLGSPNYVFEIYDGQTITNLTFANTIPNSNKVTSLLCDWLNSQKLPWNNITLGSGSDYASFLAAGDPYCIPNIAQDPCYHKSYDMKR